MTFPRAAGALLIVASLVSCASQTQQAAPKQTSSELVQPLALDGYARSVRNRYNKIYADPTQYHTEPNAFMLACLDRIEAHRERDAQEKKTDPQPQSQRTALDVGMGDGRNTIALAQRGYRSAGFDMADVGVNHARQRAAELSMPIDTRVCFFKDFAFGVEKWDVVVMMYFSVDANDMKKIQDSVRPGGCMIIERSGGDIYNEYLHEFRDWEVFIYEQDWGPRDWVSDHGNAPPGPRTQFFAKKRIQSE
jgi:2-polyprenyl-3-methyl-5-hydroxy-6-metoxy-1,4-benzoquinol methylase